MEYLVGIYARLSVEHGNAKDNSIQNQIRLAKQWLEEQNAKLAQKKIRCERLSEKQKEEEICVADRCRLQDIYVDSGCSGTTFRRPQFQRMLEDAQEGKINCIVCKDASRIGRDYLRTGEYLEKIFPLMGVRIVCVSDGYDSGCEMPGSLAGNLKNLMNEWYAKDIGRRVRLVKQQQRERGCYLGSRAPYGWQIIYCDGRRGLEKDPAAYEVIKQMAERRQQGMSYGRSRGGWSKTGSIHRNITGGPVRCIGLNMVRNSDRPGRHPGYAVFFYHTPEGITTRLNTISPVSLTSLTSLSGIFGG